MLIVSNHKLIGTSILPHHEVCGHLGHCRDKMHGPGLDLMLGPVQAAVTDTLGNHDIIILDMGQARGSPAVAMFS